ncbi:MAG TPA: sigma 54-interacting transcriptional regulator [Pyrinomonadaceae bacterium]|nr:sigma 54-interacting transcriptional regulator [Pyrinomonadaceae bacterium]
MTSIANGNAHALVMNDNQRAPQFTEEVQRTSPTPRSAAYHSDIELAGRSQAFLETMRQIDIVSSTNSPVLLTGEPGAGQELVAAAIHHRSGRSGLPFVLFNCATTPAELIEAKLFGQDVGNGLLQEADGGTIFLDEITQTSPSVQLKLMQLLQTGEIERDGSSETVNVRVIAASSCNIEQEVAAGGFCSDLFNLLNAVSIALPPLADHHIVSPGTSATNGSANGDLVTLSEIEGRYVGRVLEHTRGNKQAAARVLAVDRKTLDRMIKRHNIDCQHARALRTKDSARG